MGSSWSLESVMEVPGNEQGSTHTKQTDSPPLSLETLLERLEVSEKQKTPPPHSYAYLPIFGSKSTNTSSPATKSKSGATGASPLSKLRVGHRRPTIAIMQTCRQIQSEAQDAYIAATTYSVLHVGIRAFMVDFNPSKLRLITSIECGSDEQSVWDDERSVWDDDRGFSGKGGAARIGHMVGLRRVHIVMVEFYWRIQGKKVRDMLEEVLGRRVGLSEVDITVGEKSVTVSRVGNSRGERKRVRV